MSSLEPGCHQSFSLAHRYPSSHEAGCCNCAAPYISNMCSLRDPQGVPRLSEGQREDNEALRVELGRTLRQLGKQGLVMPGGQAIMSTSASTLS